MAIKEYSKNYKTALSTNFKSNEFNCNGNNCCTTTKIDTKLVEYLQNIRTHFGKSVVINSGYRCPVYNAATKNASKNSLHTKGQAADIVVSGIKPAEVAKYAESIGVKGIGLYEGKDGNFVHIDTRPTKSFWYGHRQEYRSTFGGTVVKGSAEVEEWQKAAKADGFKITINGVWSSECEAVAKKAVCKKPTIKGLYKNKNLTKFLQKQMGYTGNAVDGKFWTQTEKDLKIHQKKLGFVGKDVDGQAGYNTWKRTLNV